MFARSILLLFILSVVAGCADDKCEKAGEKVRKCADALDKRDISSCGTDLNECMADCVNTAYEKTGCKEIEPYYDSPNSSTDSVFAECADQCLIEYGLSGDAGV